jgi:hypothetical protein
MFFIVCFLSWFVGFSFPLSDTIIAQENAFVKGFLKNFLKNFFVQHAQRTPVRFGLGAPAAGEGERLQ